MTIENMEEFKDKMGIIDEGPIVDLDELEGDDENAILTGRAKG